MTPEQGPDTNGWSEYRRLVIAELERIDEALTALREELAGARRDIVSLQVKAGAWGFIAGLIPSLGMALIALFGGKH